MRRDTINKEEYRRRTIEMAERQNWLCAICGTWMTEPTFDHEADAV